MRKNIVFLLILCCLLSGCVTAAPAQTDATQPTEPAELIVHFIDVGQADCALLEYAGNFALIDGGNIDDGEAVVEYLENRGVQRLHLVVATHPHEDHMGGLAQVLDNFPADYVWCSALPYKNFVVYHFEDSVEAQGQRVLFPEVGQSLQLGDVTITVIGPVRTDYEDVNDLSLVLMVEYGEVRFLFTGDMEREAELDLIESGADLKADVLKVGHHGSYSSTSYLFLREVMPTYGVISVGAANDYGHPHEEPMSRLMDADVTIFRTDKMYTITAVTDGQDIRFSWKNPYSEPWIPEAA